MPYNRRPLNPLTPFVNQVVVESNAVNENFEILANAFVSNNPETYKVKEADTVDGFHASLTPIANTIKPLDASVRFYTPVVKGGTVFDPPNFTMLNNTEYFIGSVNITTSSWSPSGVWKLIFVVKSYFYAFSTGVNNFFHRVRTASYEIEGGFWYWNALSGNGMGVSDCFLIPELQNEITQPFDFYVVQGGGNANAVFQRMIVEWYLFPA